LGSIFEINRRLPVEERRARVNRERDKTMTQQPVKDEIATLAQNFRRNRVTPGKDTGLRHKVITFNTEDSASHMSNVLDREATFGWELLNVTANKLGTIFAFLVREDVNDA
jgi:hypothetical protein